MFLPVKKMEMVRIGKTASERIDKAERENLCLACLEKLDDSRTIRGCHERCYRATMRAIFKGQFTEEERVRAGKLSECSAGGRPPSSPVTIEAREKAS